MNQEIEVRPGIVSKDSEGKLQCRAIYSRIVSLFAEQNDLQFAVPGGLIGKSNSCPPHSFPVVKAVCVAYCLITQISCQQSRK